MGELALDGSVRPVKGALAMAMAAAERKVPRMLVPAANAREAAVVEEVAVFPVSTLAEAVGIVSGSLVVEPTPSNMDEFFNRVLSYEVDFSDVRGQEFAKRALVTAASGGHNVLMLGSPGTGKKPCWPVGYRRSCRPCWQAKAWKRRIYSALGRLKAEESLMATRPFRSPHHTISDAGMVGGGNPPTPGEISLAHHGVLFLDELPEFQRRTLEVLRQPLEEGRVTISRALNSSTFPANFILVAAMNPCPCGFLGDTKHTCKCSPTQIERYLGRISGPLLDRIDLHIEVPSVPFQELASKSEGTSSATMRDQVLRARLAQRERFGRESIRLNGRMTSRQMRKYCVLERESQDLLQTAMDELGLSARAHDRILRVARTLADMDGIGEIQTAHLVEAIGYRSLDRKLWAR